MHIFMTLLFFSRTECSDMGIISLDFLREYVRRHRPIALPTIIRENKKKK
jgi:hypothetical protein